VGQEPQKCGDADRHDNVIVVEVSDDDAAGIAHHIDLLMLNGRHFIFGCYVYSQYNDLILY